MEEEDQRFSCGSPAVGKPRCDAQTAGLTCRDDDPLLLGGVGAGRGGGLRADPRLRVGRLVLQRPPVAAHVAGPFGDAAVHRRAAAETHIRFPSLLQISGV